MLKFLLISALVGLSAAQFGGFSIQEFAKNLAALEGGSFIDGVASDCRTPLEQFGQCLIGRAPGSSRPVVPKNKLARALWVKGMKTLRLLRSHPDIAAIEAIGDKVDQCFHNNACTLTPMKSVKCLLDYVVFGGPYDRVTQCMKDDWDTPALDLSVPDFGSMAGLEAQVKLFAGIGLYKRLNKNHDRFWENNRDRMNIFCPASSVDAVVSCIDDAAYVAEEDMLRLHLDTMVKEAHETRKASRRGGRGRSSAPRAIPVPPGLSSQLSVFGEPEDVEFVTSLLISRVAGCGIDLATYEQREAGNRQSGQASMGSVIRMFKGEQCDIPKCIQFLWTVKESLCGECSSSIIVGQNPFTDITGFMKGAAVEYVEVVSASGDYSCQLKESGLCSKCQLAARGWQADGTDPFAGFEKEVGTVMALLEKVCNFGRGKTITADDCPNYL